MNAIHDLARKRRWWRLARLGGAVTAGVFAGLVPATAQTAALRLTDLKQLSLEQLVNLEVTTVSRKSERRWSVPSGIDVVTGEEIRRAGVQNLPDALRLATGVHVGQPSARSWAVSLRGMNVLAANKISVAMDGRSLFTPFFSGVNWDAHDALLEDIERIEVVRGPVGALWGAFAVNGFIQIFTKPAWDTQGSLATAGTGNEDPGFGAFRYGGRVGDDVYYRVYAKYSQTDWTYDAQGRQPQAATDFLQVGFRIDALRPQDTTLTLQGDYHTNRDLPLDRLQSETTGFYLRARWLRELARGSSLQLDSYADYSDRLLPGTFEEQRTTLSASAKYRFGAQRHDAVIGFDGLVSADHIGNIGVAQLLPDERTIHAVGVFLQDTLRFDPRQLALTLGIKGEHNTFSGFEYQPTARLAWTPSDATTAWAAISRGVRTPVRVDEDLILKFPGLTLFEANDDFGTETTLAYEAGIRRQFSEAVSIDLSTFAYQYENLRSTEPTGAAPVPLTFRNGLNAESFGGEIGVLLQPTAKLFIKASYRYLDLQFSRDPGSRDTSGGNAEGNDPKHVLVVGTHLDLPHDLEFDLFLRHASALPKPALPGYTTADARIGWRPSPAWEFSVFGRNLLDPQHAEFVTTNSLNEQVHRRYGLKVTWRH